MSGDNICDNFMIYLALKAKKDYTFDYMKSGNNGGKDEKSDKKNSRY